MSKNETKRKGKVLVTIAIIFAVLVVIGVGGAIACTSAERKEDSSLSIAAIDFKMLNDGTYTGEYEGMVGKMRSNKVQVTVSSGKVTGIKLLKENLEKRPPEFTDELFNRVIETQSLQVDLMDGATITSKAYLKSVERALFKAQKQQ